MVLIPSSEIGTVAALPFKGTPNYSTVHAALAPGHKVRPGELLLVEIEKSKVYSVGRVSGGTEINPYETPDFVHTRALLELESTSRREDMPRRYKVIELDLLEEAVIDGDSVIFREPQTLIEAGSPVSIPSKEIAASAAGLMPPDKIDEGLHVGNTIGAESLPVILHPNEALSRHILISGGTGTGKSYLHGVLSEEVHKLGIAQIELDVHGDWIKSTDEMNGITLRPGDDLTVPLQSLSEPEILGFIPFLTELQGEIVRRAFIELKKRSLSTHRSFNLNDLLTEIEAVGPMIEARSSTIGAARSRTDMLRFVKIIGEGTNWSQLLKPGIVLNVDCRGLEHSELQAVVGGLARELLTLRKANKVPPLALSVDESQLFLPRAEDVPSSRVLREVVRYGRHYGVGVILITPSPLDLDPRITRATNTRFIFATEPSQLGALEGVFADTPKELIERLPKLERGTCLLTGSKETVRHSILIRVRKRKTTHGGETPDWIGESKTFVNRG